MSSPITSNRARTRFPAAAAALLLAACTSTHEEPISTETGNPPVIDAARVSIAVSPDEVHLVGKQGAVEPGGVALEITILSTGEVLHAKAAPDGSFDVSVDASPDDAFELRATAAGEASNSVYLLRDGATVGEASDGSLSCEQRSQLGATLVHKAEAEADRSCNSAADCVYAPAGAVCVDSCSDAVVSRAGQAELETAIAAVEGGICERFEADGCHVIAQPCVLVPPAALECVAGQCTRADAMGCQMTCFDRQLEWVSSFGGRDGDKHTVFGCHFYTRGNAMGQCETELPHCGASTDQTTVDALLDLLARTEVVDAFASGELLGGPPTPGGALLRLNLDGSELTIARCTGANCNALPGAVQALVDMLAALETQQACEPEPSCPPNARYLQDVCIACGVNAGCMTTSTCARVCSADEQCAGDPNGSTCSSRGICERVFCVR